MKFDTAYISTKSIIVIDGEVIAPNEQYEILLNLQEAYESGAPEVDDATFDTLQSIYEKASGNKE